MKTIFISWFYIFSWIRYVCYFSIIGSMNNIRLLLQTQRGERPFQPLLGMGLRRFIFEQINEDTNVLIENEIVNVFETWLPFVDLQDIQINTEPVNSDQNKIKINIVFSIRRAPNTLESVGVVLE